MTVRDGIELLIGLAALPFVWKTPLWIAVENRSLRKLEKQIADMNAPDFIDHEQGRMRVLLCASVYFIAGTLMFSYWQPIRLVQLFLSLAALACSAMAGAHARMTDPREAAENRARLEKKVLKKKSGL